MPLYSRRKQTDPCYMSSRPQAKSINLEDTLALRQPSLHSGYAPPQRTPGYPQSRSCLVAITLAPSLGGTNPRFLLSRKPANWYGIALPSATRRFISTRVWLAPTTRRRESRSPPSPHARQCWRKQRNKHTENYRPGRRDLFMLSEPRYQCQVENRT